MLLNVADSFVLQSSAELSLLFKVDVAWLCTHSTHVRLVCIMSNGTTLPFYTKLLTRSRTDKQNPQASFIAVLHLYCSCVYGTNRNISKTTLFLPVLT